MKSSVTDILKTWGIRNYTINEDGSVDVKGNVYISGKGLKGAISDYVTFGAVGGSFHCSNNKLAPPRHLVAHKMSLCALEIFSSLNEDSHWNYYNVRLSVWTNYKFYDGPKRNEISNILEESRK